MVPQPESIVQQRCRAMLSQNPSSSVFVRPRDRPFRKAVGKAPLITYGRSSKPLSLTADQFIRRDTYDLPEDDDDSPAGSAAPAQAAQVQDDDFESSSSSGGDDSDEEAPKSASRASQLTTKVDILAAASASLRRPVQQYPAQAKKGTARPLPKAASKSKRSSDVAHDTARVAKPNVSGKRPPVPRSKHPKQKQRAQRPRLEELFLVASLPEDDITADPQSSAPGIQTRDPIVDSSHVHPLQAQSDNYALRTEPSRAPLSLLRKRLRTPKFKHKSRTLLKQRLTDRYGSQRGSTERGSVSDGFDETELEITYQVSLPKQRRRRKAPPGPMFTPLQLTMGPLPEVVFECSTAELQLKPSGGAHHVSSPRKEEQLNGLPVSLTQRSRRRVSFSDRDQLIYAQLSSVCAPARHHSDSEDEDDEGTEVDDEDAVVEGFEATEQSDEQDDDSQSDDEKAADSPPPRPKAAEPRQYSVSSARSMEIPEDVQDDDEQHSVTHLDFRTALPGMQPRLSSGRRRLMEVEETIEDVPMAATQVPASEGIEIDADDGIFEIAEEANDLRKPRSILKNSTPLVPESTYDAHDTIANTRRNSRRAKSMVELEDSHYFSTAVHLLDAPDPAKHRIIPRRSSYFDREEVLVADSERAVPETSSQPPDYTNASQLTVLRRTSENVYTSQELPDAPKDLKSLTRNVSREHGTLSQSVKRRPTLPFQSPKKMVR